LRVAPCNAEVMDDVAANAGNSPPSADVPGPVRRHNADALCCPGAGFPALTLRSWPPCRVDDGSRGTRARLYFWPGQRGALDPRASDLPEVCDLSCSSGRTD
jgi:hypothetical protein